MTKKKREFDWMGLIAAAAMVHAMRQSGLVPLQIKQPVQVIKVDNRRKQFKPEELEEWLNQP